MPPAAATGGATGSMDAGATESTAGATGAAAGSSGGAAGSSGTAAGTEAPPVDEPPPRPRETEPVIPTPRGECPELATGTVTVMGMTVEVLAGTPGASPGPVLLVWHGTGMTGKDAIGLLPTAMKDEITAPGGIVFAPNSDGETRDGTDTGSVLNAWFTSDFALADELVACAHAHHGIDPRRIYTTGCTSGGLMAGAFTVARSSYVAAAVINSGGLISPDAFTLQDPARVPSVISLYGISELIVVTFEHSSRLLVETIRAAGGFAIDCPLDVNHCVPPVEVQERSWEFLKAHPFGVAPFPYADGLPVGLPESCRIAPN
jgi:predicted esterase